MPKATLPTTLKGWVASIISSLVGFISGLAALSLIDRMWK